MLFQTRLNVQFRRLDNLETCRQGIFEFDIAVHGLGGPGGDFGSFAECVGEDVDAFFVNDGGVDVEADGVGFGEHFHGVGDVVSGVGDGVIGGEDFGSGGGRAVCLGGCGE